MQSSLRLLLLLSLTVLSCGTADEKRQKTDTHTSSAENKKIDTPKKQIATSNYPVDTDTLTIDRIAAIFYQPDSIQIKKRMKQVGEADFRAGADDYIYYINSSVEYLEKQGIPVIDAKNRKFLRFVMTDKKEKLIKLDTLEELWGIYLFDPMKAPLYADMIDIEENYKNYYK